MLQVDDGLAIHRKFIVDRALGSYFESTPSHVVRHFDGDHHFFSDKNRGEKVKLLAHVDCPWPRKLRGQQCANEAAQQEPMSDGPLKSGLGSVGGIEMNRVMVV